MSQDSQDDGASALARLRNKAFALRDHLSVPIRIKAHKASIRAEHWGFVAIAAVDAFHWHSYLFAVSVWLLVTGLIAEFMGGVE